MLGVAWKAPSSDLRQWASFPTLLLTNNLGSSTQCTTLEINVRKRQEQQCKWELTYIRSSDWCSLCPIGPSVYAIFQCEGVVELAEDSPAELFHSTNGGLGSS